MFCRNLGGLTCLFSSNQRAQVRVAIEQGVFTKSVKDRLESLEAAQEELKVKLLQAQIEKDVLTKEKVIFYLKQFRKLDLLKLENKQALVDNLINRVILFDDKIAILFNHNEKQTTISLDKIKCSDLVGVNAVGRVRRWIMFMK